jgi:pimeloyl-ACP methyl ester carboxylesterase
MRTAFCILLLLPALALGEEDGYDKVLRKFERQLEKSDLDRRVEAFRLLDLENPRSLPPLKKVLSRSHWFLRGHGAETIARMTVPALRAELRLDLLTHEDPLVREGIALAFLLAPETGDAEALSEALGDGDWRVRATAARALAGIVSKQSLAALVAALRTEADSRVAAILADTLRKLTGANFGRDPEAWRAWWEANKDREAFEKLTEETKRRELGGIPLDTVTVETRRSPGPGAERRPDILVLAPFGWTHDVYRPYLDELTRFARVTYVNLPKVNEITRHSGYGSSVPVYPVAKLVRALEELREELGRKKVVILAEGATGWIAERYAVSHPRRTAGLVILNGYVDSASYAQALSRLTRSPTPAERWAALTLLNQNAVPHDERAHRQIARVLLTADLMEPTDSRGWLLWKNAQDPQGFATVPDLRFHDRTRIETPVAFFFGGQHRLSGYFEAERIRTHFPNNVIAVLHKSRGFPYVSEYDEFYRVLSGFFTYYKLL